MLNVLLIIGIVYGIFGILLAIHIYFRDRKMDELNSREDIRREIRLKMDQAHQKFIRDEYDKNRGKV